MRILKGIGAIVLALVLYFALWPVPIEPVAWDAPTDQGLTGVFAENDRLAKAKVVSLGEHNGPEDIAVAFDDRLYAGTEDGKIISFDSTGSDVQVFADVGGRPLGLEFVGGYLYVANSFEGLQRVRKDGATVTLVSEFEGTPIPYADDLAVADDGTVYFSDASTKFGAREWQGTYSASLLDIVEHGGHGRILKYDPFANQTSLVMDGLNFANGVAISDDQQYLLIAETGSYRIHRYWLDGPDAGSSEVILDNLPGFPDNINNGRNGRFWVGLIAPRVKILDDTSGDPFARKIMQRMPPFLRPQAEISTHLIAIDGNGEVLMNLQDSAATFPNVTGAIETDRDIILTSLFGSDFARLSKDDL